MWQCVTLTVHMILLEASKCLFLVISKERKCIFFSLFNGKYVVFIVLQSTGHHFPLSDGEGGGGKGSV